LIRLTDGRRKDILMVLAFLALSAGLLILPTGYEARVKSGAIRCRGRIVEVDNSGIQRLGIIKKGNQAVEVEILDGPFAGQTLSADNPLMGRLDLDKIYQPGDTALTVLSVNADGEIVYVNPQDHYRLGLELALLGLFAALLLAFGGWTGLKALLSFAFTALMLWKLLIPLFLKGFDPVYLTLGAVAVMSAAVIFLVAGPTRKGVVAFCGAFLGVLTSCILGLVFTRQFHINGAILPFAETLLYSGFGHLDLTRIYVAAVYLAASGAVMDLAVDVAAAMDEVVTQRPDIGTVGAIRSGMNVGRAVVGTMTTTLLLAYSGGYVTLLMAFMAQGVPLANLFNLIYVAAEVLKTIVGSFGLVTVAPFTALVGGLVLARRPAREEK
jgi:uncharacterized membrane protein